MWNWLLTVLISAYPARNTYECLRRPVRGGLRHWCIFWFLFSSLQILDPIASSFIPFWQFLKTTAIVLNYGPGTTEITYKGIKGLIHHCSSRWQRNPELRLGLARTCDRWLVPSLHFLESNLVPILPLFISPVVSTCISGFRSLLPTLKNENENESDSVAGSANAAIIGPYRDANSVIQ